MGRESAIVSIRASKANNFFDVPRWHMDGNFFMNRMGRQIKFAAVLKGNHTLFCLPSPEIKGKINHLKRAENASLLKDQNIYSPILGEGVFFKVGSIESIAAVHSEPPIDGDRLFFSVMPGDHKEIDERNETSKMIKSQISEHELEEMKQRQFKI